MPAIGKEVKKDIKKVQKTIEKRGEELHGEMEEKLGELEAYIKKEPLKAVTAAFLLGVFIGKVMK